MEEDEPLDDFFSVVDFEILGAVWTFSIGEEDAIDEQVESLKNSLNT